MIRESIRSRVFVLTLIGVAMIAGACGDSADGTPAPTPPLGLTFTLDVGPADSNGAIPLSAVLFNAGTTSADFGLVGNGPPSWDGAFNFVVTDEAGEQVWLSYDRPVLLQLTPVSLGPGETMVFESGWGGENSEGAPVRPGTFHVRATLSLQLEQPNPELGPEHVEVATATEEIRI
jgi:hypothetical protein